MKIRRIVLFLSVALVGFAPTFLHAADRLRVDVPNGAPRILVDDQPVRDRMFWGNPGSRPFRIEKEAKRISFEFQPSETELKRGTMHLRFGNEPTIIYFDDILIEELRPDETPASKPVAGPYRFENGMDEFHESWKFYPLGAANTTATVDVVPKSGNDGSSALVVRLAAPKDGKWPDFHLYHNHDLSLDRTKTYRVSFWVRSEKPTELRVAFYRPGHTYTLLASGGDKSGDFFANQIKMAGKSGARFVSFFVPMPWPAPGEEVDWTPVDSVCRRVLDANPDALLLPRIRMGAPTWWLDANPGEVIRWKGTPSTSQGKRVETVSSLKFRKDAAERLDALVRYMEKTFGPSMAGYHPAGQNTCEWFYQDTWGPALNGYADADRKAWRVWLAQRYTNDDALRAAWGDPKATLSGAEVPTPELRQSIRGGIFRDVAVEKTQQAVLDFTEFQQDMMVDTVLELARTVRNATEGKRLVVFFYGYLFEFSSVRNGPGTSGHYAISKVLKSPDIDILCSPISYNDRQSGGSGAAMTAAESVALAGKLWLYEDDTRTYLTPRAHRTVPGGRDGADTVEETIQLLLRNTAQCAVRNFATWWMDLTSSGWFDDPRLWTEMKRLERLDRIFLDRPTPFRPEIAAFVDEASMMAVAFQGGRMSGPTVGGARTALARVGAPYGQYLLDDFLAGKTDAKLNVFLAAWRLSGTQRQALKARAAKPGTVNVWCFAPGFLDSERGGSLETMHELLGFKTKRLDGIPAWAEPTELGRKLGLETGVGVKQPIQPLFAVEDAKPEETLAVYEDGSPAVALRSDPSGAVSIFVGPPGLTPSLLRMAAVRAKAHLFTQKDCNVYANGNVVVLHGAEDGPVEVDFGKPCRIVDLLDGTTLGTGPKRTIPLKRGETRILECLEN